MEYGHNLAKDGTTSVKVHHQPGGASSFSLGHDGGEDDDEKSPRMPAPKATTAAIA